MLKDMCLVDMMSFQLACCIPYMYMYILYLSIPVYFLLCTEQFLLTYSCTHVYTYAVYVRKFNIYVGGNGIGNGVMLHRVV